MSINRVNGEGAEVTARGFGGGFNLVTLNGRQLPATNLQGVGGDQSVDFATATGRSFDFGNLASEGVSTLEVYKTGRAAIPTGGIGATINVITRKPLDSASRACPARSVPRRPTHQHRQGRRRPGQGHAGSVGLLNWKNDSDTFGVALFGSYQKRNSAAASSTSNAWNIRTIDNPGDIFGANTVINNRPGRGQPDRLPERRPLPFLRIDPRADQRFGRPAIRPVDNLLLTADVLWAQNRQNEARQDLTNWLNRPFGTVTFDNSPVPTATVISQAVPDPKDTGYEQQFRATKDKLEEYGLNAAWDVTDKFKLVADIQHSKSQALPDASNGASSTLFSMGANVVNGQTIDWSRGFPSVSETINDCNALSSSAGPGRVIGNCNGQLDAGDLGTQVARTNSRGRSRRSTRRRSASAGISRRQQGRIRRQLHRFEAALDPHPDHPDAGRLEHQQSRRGRGAAGGLLKTFCLVCKFDHFKPGVTGPGLNAFRGNAVALNNIFSPLYAARGNPVTRRLGERRPHRGEDRLRLWPADLEGPDRRRGPRRWSSARATRSPRCAPSRCQRPSAIVWTSDNDFNVPGSSVASPLTGRGSYDNLLPAIDFQISPFENVITRVSFSKTIARPSYGDQFVSSTAGAGSRATLFGGQPNGTTAIPICARSSRTISTSRRNGISSRRATCRRLLRQTGAQLRRHRPVQRQSVRAARRDHRGGGIAVGHGGRRAHPPRPRQDRHQPVQLLRRGWSRTAATSRRPMPTSAPTARAPRSTAAISTSCPRSVDITPDANDPLAIFSIASPINNRDAEIYGAEFAGQYFFGRTGIGVAASYTLVRGNVGIDVLAAPTADHSRCSACPTPPTPR